MAERHPTRRLKGRDVAIDAKGAPLTCYGCFHADDRVRWPGQPGDRPPCFFCIRNPDRDIWHEHAHDALDGRPMTWSVGRVELRLPCAPRDLYITTDRLALQFEAMGVGAEVEPGQRG